MHGCDVTEIDPAAGADARLNSETLGSLMAAMMGLAAAWTAAGSVGLLAHPLRRALTLLLFGAAILVYRPAGTTRTRGSLALLLAVVGAVAGMIVLPMMPANVAAAAVVLAYLAFTSTGRQKDILLAASTAVALFGLYRFAVASVPWLWLAADSVGTSLGSVAGLITGRPVRVGATFAGLDFLVLTTAVWVVYLPFTKPPRVVRALYGFAGILGGHLLYLVLLSYVPGLLAAAPLPTDSAVGSPIVRLLHQAVPWNLPVVACGIHLLVMAAMFHWSARLPNNAEEGRTAQTSDARRPAGRHVHACVDMLKRMGTACLHTRKHGTRPDASLFTSLHLLAAVVAAVSLPVIAVLYPHPLSPAGKKVVFYEKGFLNWLKPVHDSYGRLSSGMYGMLPVFIESLGARALVSPDLSEDDLKDADVLVLIFPDEPWQEGRLQRIHDFVRAGGSLLVLGEHTTQDAGGKNRFNEVLAPARMRVQFDSATFAVGGWLQSYEALGHPMTAGIADDQNQFGMVIGASLAPRWPARPVIVGRWGWSDLGDEASSRAMMGNDRYDAGEKLGDLVLAAEQPLGKGRIVALGDTSGLTNAINVSSYVFTSRLFAYLAARRAHAHPAWRQTLALLMAVFLAGLLCCRPTARKTLLVVMGLVASLMFCTAANRARAKPLPDGRGRTPNNLAYIDESHVEACSGESWRPDGIGGLALTLMRNGYLTLTLPELTPQRLERAGLLISIAPSRRFSRAEVETIETFVSNGGLFILTVGYDQAAPSRRLLDAFDLRVGLPGNEPLEPEPLGHFKSPYLEAAGKRVYVRFHAAWPVACEDANAQVMAYGRNNRPVIILRRLGKGAVLLIGDSYFATNMNLEYESGAAFEGLRENADFWRWLLTVLRNEPMWVPSLLRTGPAGTAQGGSNQEAQP